MFQSRLYGISAFFLACISCSLLCASNVEAKSIEDRSWSNSNPRLVQAANRRDETIEIVSHRGVVSEEIEVHVPEASFVKLHFSKFELPHGVIIEVSNPGGTEVYRYSNSWKDALTFDPLLEDGVTSFSAMSISGDTALIRVLGRHGLVRPGEHGVEIDYLMEGLPERAVVGLDDLSGTGSQTQAAEETDGPAIESVCGGDDRRDVPCFDGSNPAEVDRSRPVVKLLIDGATLCTGWRVGSGNRLLTNRHCLPNQATTSATEVWFNYQRIECGMPGVAPGLVKVPADSLLASSVALDYALFTVSEFDSISGFGHLGLDIDDGFVGDQIYIPQHGTGAPKQLSLESDMNGSGWCEIDAVNLDGYATGTDVGYFCDTTSGSSGSPVLAEDSGRAVALHHLGGCFNQGVSISLIWPEIAEFFGFVVPVGDNEDPLPNSPPAAIFSTACGGLHCEFDASSSFDPDGSISSYQWTLGDGTIATGAQISHSYASEGLFEVMLTVVDNDGEPGEGANMVAPAADFELRATSQKDRGAKSVHLTWSGALSDQVEILRAGSLLTTTVNDGEHTDYTVPKRSKSASYQLCLIGGGTCTDEVRVEF
jgi:hypothetical protein